jgi:homospermidine synthase
MQISFSGKLVMVGFGSVGQAFLPILLRHLTITPDRITIITSDDRGNAVAKAYGIEPIIRPLTKENYEGLLSSHLKAGDFLLNLSVDVSSLDLIELCQRLGALYLDTCIEPWAGVYMDPNLTPSDRSNYALREQVLNVKHKYTNGPTAIVAHGANPGLVSHFTKQALLTLAKDSGKDVKKPTTRQEWATLAHQLNVKVIHIAEHDTQDSPVMKQPGEFVNTWSVDGILSEGAQPSELGWGAHEKHFPQDGKHHTHGCQAAIYLNRPSLSTKVRTWTPLGGPVHGFLVTHNEAISIADFFTVKSNGSVEYRPTVHYAYHPSNDTILSISEVVAANFKDPQRKRLLLEEIHQGMDELGVLLMGHERGAFWFGSQLSIDEARKIAPHNNATSMQIASGVLAGVVLAIQNPQMGIVESDDLDFEKAIEIARPYLGTVLGKYTDWTPLDGRNNLYPEDVDTTDPWQFKNFRVA